MPSEQDLRLAALQTKIKSVIAEHSRCFSLSRGDAVREAAAAVFAVALGSDVSLRAPNLNRDEDSLTPDQAESLRKQGLNPAFALCNDAKDSAQVAAGGSPFSRRPEKADVPPPKRETITLSDADRQALLSLGLDPDLVNVHDSNDLKDRKKDGGAR
jgi:hypothetical protein